MGDIPGHFVGYSPKLPYPELRLFPTLAEPAVRSVSRFDCSVSASRGAENDEFNDSRYHDYAAEP